MKKVFSLADDTSLEFDDATAIDYAVAYAYHLEENNTASRFFRSVQDNDGWWQQNTPFVRGTVSIAAGNWGAITEETN